jgi:hypothetical protein
MAFLLLFIMTDPPWKLGRGKCSLTAPLGLEREGERKRGNITGYEKAVLHARQAVCIPGGKADVHENKLLTDL